MSIKYKYKTDIKHVELVTGDKMYQIQLLCLETKQECYRRFNSKGEAEMCLKELARDDKYKEVK